jgi:hypothetical protein
MAAPQAPLARLPGSGSWAGRGREANRGPAVPGLARGRSCRGPGDLLQDGTGGGQGTAGLTWARGRCAAPGDMMIDRASSRLKGMRPLSLCRPSAWPCAAGPGAADSGLAGAGRGYAPPGESGPAGPAGRVRIGRQGKRDAGLRRQ